MAGRDRRLQVARVGIGVAALAKAAIVVPDLFALAGPGAIRIPMAPWLPLLPAAAVPVVAAAWLLCAVAFLLGVRTRWSGAALSLVLLLVLLGDQQLYSNHLYLLLTVVVLITVGLAGLDWAATLLRAQVSIVYGFAGVAKLNLLFLSGAVLSTYLGRESIVGFPDGARTFALMAALSFGAILVEAFLASAFWSRRLRPVAFVVGLLFHLGIVLMVGPTGDLLVFALIMFSLYVFFIEGQPGSRLVVWDDHCGFCGTWVHWFRRLDGLGLHRFEGSSAMAELPAGMTRSDTDEAIQLVEADGSRNSGFEAVSGVLEVLPATFLWAPLLRMGWVRRWGDAAYRRVAARRSCSVYSRPAG